MGVNVTPDWASTASTSATSVQASQRDAGPLGFAGTATTSAHRAAGLVTLSSGEDAPNQQVPLLPESWGNEPEQTPDD